MVAAGVTAVLALAWLLLLSPVLELRLADVEVRGTGTVVAVDDVVALVQERAGTPLPRLDTRGLRDEILDVPGVRDVGIARSWPHGLTITVEAREPVAAVPAAGRAGYDLLDEEGIKVGHLEAAPPGLPVVQVPVGDKRTLAAVLTVLRQLPEDLVTRVGGVSAQTQDTVTMQLRDGPRVDWGSGAQTALKAAVLTTMLAAPATAGASVIDVSAPSMPVVK